MGDILKFLPVSVLFQFLPMILIKVGNMLKQRDTDSKGADDTFGDIMIAAAPAIDGIFTGGHDTAVRKAVTAIREGCDAYLKGTPVGI